MFENLDIFKMSHAMAVHAGRRQAVAAMNVANADTPDYKARDIAPFSDIYSQRNEPDAAAAVARATRAGHMHGSAAGQQSISFVDPNGIAAPNGNTVSLDMEMLKSLNAKRQHDRALAIYRSSLTVLRTVLSKS